MGPDGTYRAGVIINAMGKKGFALLEILIVAAVLAVIAGGGWYVSHLQSEQQAATSGQQAVQQAQQTVRQANQQTQQEQNVLNQAEGTNAATTTESSSTPSNTVAIVASSTTQVGAFTIVANCSFNSLGGFQYVSRIDVLKGSSTVQSIRTKGIASGTNACPKPQSQDINFDGYPDFLIPADYGTGGISYVYLLFNTSTQQFYCPSGFYGNCTLENPGFDPTTKTVTSGGSLGATDSFLQTYRTTGGVLTLYQETDISYSPDTKTTIKTVKQLVNGQMVVVSTSTAGF